MTSFSSTSFVDEESEVVVDGGVVEVDDEGER